MQNRSNIFDWWYHIFAFFLWFIFPFLSSITEEKDLYDIRSVALEVKNHTFLASFPLMLRCD